MPVKDLPIWTYYDRQRFLQASPMDCANWYQIQSDSIKKKRAMYPCMGRSHIKTADNINVMQFASQPRAIFKSINFMYVVVGGAMYQINSAWSQIAVAMPAINPMSSSGPIYFAFLPVITAIATPTQTQAVYCMFTSGGFIYVIDESMAPAAVQIIDPNAPKNALYVAAFGNRFVVSSLGSTEFRITNLNSVDATTGTFNAATIFTNKTGNVIFAQETGIIQQFAVLHAQLYMFTDYTTGIWANLPSMIGTEIFPWKKTSSYDWDYGIADPLSIDVDFGRMVWLAQNRNGLIQFMTSDGQMPQSISTQAINVLLQQSATNSLDAPYLSLSALGFLYQYEDTISYRISTGPLIPDTGILYDSASSLEYNFDSQTWHRCIEKDGDRNLILDHIFFNNIHVVNVLGQASLYNMAGNIYTNELLNPASTDPQSATNYITYPMRYELVTPIISEEDYSEFITDYIEIDFIWGEQAFIRSNGPFLNTVYIVAEPSSSDVTEPVYLVAEDGVTFIVAENSDYATLNDTTYDALFKPHIELYISDNGGVTFYTADVLEFSQLGIYQWRMRWYQGGTSRNRVYKLICVSPAPIVILGAVQNTRRASGGAN